MAKKKSEMEKPATGAPVGRAVPAKVAKPLAPALAEAAAMPVVTGGKAKAEAPAKPKAPKAPVKPKAAAPAKPAAKQPAKPASGAKAAAEPIRPSMEDLTLRAYFIGEKRLREGLPGDATSDWVQAERELIAELNGPKTAGRSKK
jgi:hypothetical protein